MSTLLDTCAVLWAAREPTRLPPRARSLLLDPAYDLVLSVASAWEIAVKPELGITDAAGWVSEAARRSVPAFFPFALSTLPCCRPSRRCTGSPSTGY